MGLRAEYALHHSGLEAFLFAPLWQEENGSVLSVLSALARLGTDPWGEAAILASKPKKDAAEALAAILARLPKASLEHAGCVKVAERAVKLLPNADLIDSAKASDDSRSNIFAKHGSLILTIAAAIALLLTLEWPT